jgi:hypothetical protein
VPILVRAAVDLLGGEQIAFLFEDRTQPECSDGLGAAIGGLGTGAVAHALQPLPETERLDGVSPLVCAAVGDLRICEGASRLDRRPGTKCCGVPVPIGAGAGCLTS